MTVRNTVQIDERLCTGCGICVENCPTDVFRLDSGRGTACVAYPEDCQACFVCVFDCPYDGAVRVRVELSEDTRMELSRGQFREALHNSKGDG